METTRTIARDAAQAEIGGPADSGRRENAIIRSAE